MSSKVRRYKCGGLVILFPSRIETASAESSAASYVREFASLQVADWATQQR